MNEEFFALTVNKSVYRIFWRDQMPVLQKVFEVKARLGSLVPHQEILGAMLHVTHDFRIKIFGLVEGKTSSIAAMFRSKQDAIRVSHVPELKAMDQRFAAFTYGCLTAMREMPNVRFISEKTPTADHNSGIHQPIT